MPCRVGYQPNKTSSFECSPFLLAAWDPEREEFQSVCRCMSGFTDVFYTEAGSFLIVAALQTIYAAFTAFKML